MTNTPERGILEAMARAICEQRCGAMEYSIWDESLGAVDKEEFMLEARAALTAALDRMMEPSMGMCDKGADMPAAGDDFPEAIAKWVWQAMFSQLRKDVLP